MRQPEWQRFAGDVLAFGDGTMSDRTHRMLVRRYLADQAKAKRRKAT